MQKLLKQFYQTSVTCCELKGDKGLTFPPFFLDQLGCEISVESGEKCFVTASVDLAWCHVGCVYNVTCRMTWINQNNEIFYLHCYIYLHMELLSVVEEIGSFCWEVFQLFSWRCSQTYTPQTMKESSYLVILINCHGYTLTERFCLGTVRM